MTFEEIDDRYRKAAVEGSAAEEWDQHDALEEDVDEQTTYEDDDESPSEDPDEDDA